MPKYLALFGHSHIHWLMSKFVKEGNRDDPNAKLSNLANLGISKDDLRVTHYGSRGMKIRHIENNPESEFWLFSKVFPAEAYNEAILWLGDNDI